MALATPKVVLTRIGVMPLGSRWRKRIDRSGSPAAIGGLHEILFSQAEEFGADEAGIAGPAGEADDGHHDVEISAEEGDEGDQQEEGGDGLEDFDEPHAEKVDRAGEITHESADDDADDDGDAGGDQSDARAIRQAWMHAAEDVAAVGFGADEVLAAGGH